MNGQNSIFSPANTPSFMKAQRMYFLAFTLGFVGYLTFAISMLASVDNITPMDQPVGGDYMVFWVAARAIMDGAAAQIYEFANFSEYLNRLGPPMKDLNLSWQYPPTYLFAVLPLTFVPFGLGYALWSGGSALIFAGICKKLFNLNTLQTLVIIATPVSFIAVLTGQNGFMTASLLLLAIALPDKRPIVAGICAGLLTIKPQLGLLIPFAYIAGGYWRSFCTAAIVSLAMIAATLAVFGPDVWFGFFHSLDAVKELVNAGLFPLERMRTIYSTAIFFGMPSALAMTVQILIATTAAFATLWVWLTVRAMDLRVAFLISAVFLCTPYGYHYEMIVLLPAFIILLQRAYQTGIWYKAEEIFILAFWAFILLQQSIPDVTKPVIGLAMIFCLMGLIIRRAVLEEGLRLPAPPRKIYIPIGL